MEQPSPAAAQALGLGVVYQHLSILEDLTVAENMVFAMPRGAAAVAAARRRLGAAEARGGRRRASIPPRASAS